MDKKTCAICGKEKPLNKEHFRYRIQNDRGYFTAECRDCISREKQASRERKKQRQAEAMDNIEQAGVAVFLSNVAKGGSNVPHTAEVVERVMSYFGGVAGFSSVLVKQFWDADPGGSQRNKILETMCRLISQNVESGGAKKPLAFWSEEELEEELDKRLSEAVAGYTGVTIDAATEKAPEGLPAPVANTEGGYNAIPERLDQGIAGGVEGSEAGGFEAVPAKPKPRRDSQESGE